MSQVEREPIAIDYMPWAALDEEFQVGPVSFWPFYSKAEEKIADPDVRANLTRFFKTFVDNSGQPVRTVVVCSCGEIGFRRFSPEELQAIRAAVDCLIFAVIASGTRNAVCANNNSMAPPSADRFDLCARWVYPCHPGMVVATQNSLNYWSLDKYHIPQPLSVGGSFCGNYAPLLQGLSRVFDAGFPEAIRERLFRCFEWFRFAHTESTAVSWQHKVVMMATAFEILLKFPDGPKRQFFVHQVHANLRLPGSYMVTLPDGQEVCKAAEWAGQFYRLRNAITHGDAVPFERLQYKDWVTHLIVADLMLLELVKRLLYEHQCIGDDIRQKAVKWSQDLGGSVEDTERDLLPSMFGLDLKDVHEALGWVPPRDGRIGKRRKQMGNDSARETD